MSKFMFVFRGGGYADSSHPLSPTELQAHLAKWGAWSKVLMEKHQGVGHPLSHPPTGKTLRGRERAVTDGPYAETKDLVSGIVIVEAESLDAATLLARDCPIFEMDGSVEIRPVMDEHPR